MNKPKVLITGGSSGIGEAFAKYYSKLNYEVVIIGRSIEKLNQVKQQINCNIVQMDLSNTDNCIELFNQYPNIDILINNAGFGEIDSFNNIALNKELSMIDINIKALHTLTKLYLINMLNNKKGVILNVASVASFFPGPQMATYHATKAYVLSLTRSISYEVRKYKDIYIGALCPGTVVTPFWNDIKVKGKTPEYIVNYSIKQMKKKKKVIVPTITMKLVHVLTKIVPTRFTMYVMNNMRKKQTPNKKGA